MTSELSNPEQIGSAAGTGGMSLKYVLITPARNEAAFIEETIQAMVAQTVRPEKWVIVSDGSTDGTDDIVKRYAGRHSWIELVRAPERTERHFAGKVHAFNAGYARVKDMQYDVIGNLDADITFDSEYFAFLLRRFSLNPGLGVAGTPYTENDKGYDYRFTSIEHVSGACQLFRRKCFEEIGGYVPIKIGGIDLMAVITARMKGWQTRTFLEKHCVHHRTLGTAKQNAFLVALRGGKGDYRLGMHPLWEFSRTFYQMTRRPYVAGALLRLSGFMWAMLTRAEKLVPAETVRFRRAEQMKRLARFIAWKRQIQRCCWIYVTENFFITTQSRLRETETSATLRFVPVGPENYLRVAEFRGSERVSEYAAKVGHGEIGFFAEADDRMAGSIWATINTTAAPLVARGHIRLKPGEALIHDIVTGERSRSRGIGTFMVRHMAEALLAQHGVNRIIVDVNSRNRPSLRMMNKAGLRAAEQVLSISTFGRLLLQKRLRRYSEQTC